MKATRQIYILAISILWFGIYEYYKWLQRNFNVWDASNFESRSLWFFTTACLSLVIVFGMAFIYFYKKRHGWDEKPSFLLFISVVFFMLVLNYAVFTIYYIFLAASFP
jgi:hypothetical protein